MQLDHGSRGFSFSKEGPLDMRMDPTSPVTAKEIVNTYSEEKLSKIFWEFGEEPGGRKVARAIVEARRKRPIETTKELVDVILSAVGRFIRKGLHPATLIFQALRICVNRELEAVQTALRKAIKLARPGGVLSVISFHSLEDRIVKNMFRDGTIKILAGEFEQLPVLKLLTKKPITATREELRINPRASSANNFCKE